MSTTVFYFLRFLFRFKGVSVLQSFLTPVLFYKFTGNLNVFLRIVVIGNLFVFSFGPTIWSCVDSLTVVLLLSGMTHGYSTLYVTILVKLLGNRYGRLRFVRVGY